MLLTGVTTPSLLVVIVDDEVEVVTTLPHAESSHDGRSPALTLSIRAALSRSAADTLPAPSNTAARQTTSNVFMV